MINLKNKSSVILNPERSEWVSRSHVTSVESVVNDGAKTKRYSAKRDLYARSPKGSRLKMTMISCFALLFTIAITSESWAGKICNCGTKGHETECCWEIKEITSDGKTEKILTVSAGIDSDGNSYKDAQMKDFSSTKDENGNSINNAPWKEYADEITSIEVNGVKNIGDKAFIAMKNVASASMDNSVISVGRQSFFENKKLVSINFSDSLETIDDWAFSRCPKLTTIEIPDTVKSIGGGAFWYYSITTDISVPDSAVISPWFAFGDRNVKIICRGTDETCADMREKLSHYCINTSSNCVNEEDFIDLSDRVVLADANNCDSSKYYWSGTSCNNKKNGIKCDENWKRNEDFCNRIRYTPAEASQVLRDDNTNEVTITFKK